MKLAGCLLLIPLLAGGAFAQRVTRSFGSVVFPGGTSAISPNISRTFGSVVFPGGSPSSLRVPSAPVIVPSLINGRSSFGLTGGNSFGRSNSFVNSNSFQRPGGTPSRGVRRSPAAIYAYPVYVPGYYDAPASQDMVAPQVQPADQPNVTVVYPQQEAARPIIIQMGADEYGQPTARRSPSPRTYVAPEPAAPEEPDTPHYLIAFKDHSIYSTIAYWFDGDTLHYFTRGDTHNQAPVGLIDRTLTERLNRELGIDFKMPPAK
jgi:hypothetical protein